MTFDLHKWTSVDRKALMTLCNAVDRTFLSDRLPYPYTEADADWWLGMVAENNGKEGESGIDPCIGKNGFQLERTKIGGVVKDGKAMDVKIFVHFGRKI